MTEVKKLYRVVKEEVYDGGRGCNQVRELEVLYCGYDKDEARRKLHSHPVEQYRGPGNYYTRVRCLSKRCN